MKGKCKKVMTKTTDVIMGQGWIADKTVSSAGPAVRQVV